MVCQPLFAALQPLHDFFVREDVGFIRRLRYRDDVELDTLLRIRFDQTTLANTHTRFSFRTKQQRRETGLRRSLSGFDCACSVLRLCLSAESASVVDNSS